jgi:hypothetical protein
MSAPPVLLPFNVLQPQKISANGSAPARGTENQDDPAAATVQPPAATTDAEIQVDLTPGATIPPGPVADLPGVRPASPRALLPRRTQILYRHLCHLRQLHQLRFRHQHKMLCVPAFSLVLESSRSTLMVVCKFNCF